TRLVCAERSDRAADTTRRCPIESRQGGRAPCGPSWHYSARSTFAGHQGESGQGAGLPGGDRADLPPSHAQGLEDGEVAEAPGGLTPHGALGTGLSRTANM